MLNKTEFDLLVNSGYILVLTLIQIITLSYMLNLNHHKICNIQNLTEFNLLNYIVDGLFDKFFLLLLFI